MNAKSLCQIVTLAASIPAGMALRGAMRAIEHNKNNPTPEAYKPPMYSAIFGAVLGLVIQTVPYCAIHIARTGVVSSFERQSELGTTKISYIYTSNYTPKSALEAVSNFATAHGFYTMATESFDFPKTVIQFKTTHNDQTVYLKQSYDGFLSKAQMTFTRPTVTQTKEQLNDKEKEQLIAKANDSFSAR